jgi:Leucine Rich repeat
VTTAPSTTPKPRRRWYQYSLRTLMVLMLAIGCGLGWFTARMRQARSQRKTVETIAELNGWVGYDYEFDASNHRIQGAQPSGPAWLRSVLGGDFFDRVVFVDRDNYGAIPSDAWWEELRRLPYLQTLYVKDATDARLAALEGLKCLVRLKLDGGEITAAGLEHLKGLTQLRDLDLQYTKVTDDGLEPIERLTQLTTLHLAHTAVTDAGLEHVKKLTQLQELDLERGQDNRGRIRRI